MAQAPEPDKKANDQPQPKELPSPKRGAVPTPKEDIEKATPYVPDTDRAGDHSATTSVGPTDDGPKEDTQEDSPIVE